MRMNSGMSSALWCVLNGRAAAPLTSECIIGVSTSRKSRASRNSRMNFTSRERFLKVSRTEAFERRST